MRLKLERLEQRNLLAGDLIGSAIDIFAFAPSSPLSDASVDSAEVRSERNAAKPEYHQVPATIEPDKFTEDRFKTHDGYDDDQLPRVLVADTAWLVSPRTVQLFVTPQADLLVVKQGPVEQIIVFYSDVDSGDNGSELASHDKIEVEDDPVVKSKPAENANDSAAVAKLAPTSIATDSASHAHKALIASTSGIASPQPTAPQDSSQVLIQVNDSIELGGAHRTEILNFASSDNNEGGVVPGAASDSQAVRNELRDATTNELELSLLHDRLDVADGQQQNELSEPASQPVANAESPAEASVGALLVDAAEKLIPATDDLISAGLSGDFAAVDLAMHQLLNNLDELRSDAVLLWDESQVAKLSLPIAVGIIAAEIARRRSRYGVTPTYESTDEHLALWMYPECSGLAGRTQR